MASRWGFAIGVALSAAALAACGGSSGGASTSGNDDLFTSAGFEKANSAVGDKAGENAQVLQVQVTQGGADYTSIVAFGRENWFFVTSSGHGVHRFHGAWVDTNLTGGGLSLPLGTLNGIDGPSPADLWIAADNSVAHWHEP